MGGIQAEALPLVIKDVVGEFILMYVIDFLVF